MSSVMEEILNRFKQIIRETNKKKTSPYDTAARVVRVEGDTIWVHIPGGEENSETPVNRTVDAKAGDYVQVRVSGGNAFLVGNATAPPTDNAYAQRVNTVLTQEIKATNVIVKGVQKAVSAVRKIADNTNQYFWHTEEGTDTGAHITEIPQEEFLADPENGGGNLLARSNGIAVRDGLDELAIFGVNGSRIGKENESNMSIDYHSIIASDRSGNDYFHISDLRDVSGYATLTYEDTGDGSTVRYTVGVFVSQIVSVFVDGVDQTQSVSISSNGYIVIFSVAPADGANIVITYMSNSKYAKAYTAGMRQDGNVGGMSFVEGVNNIAQGFASSARGNSTTALSPYSISEGYGTVARGYGAHAEGLYSETLKNYSHAEGNGTIASAEFQHVIGCFNEKVDNALFIVGCGTSNSNRKNAFVVYKGGEFKGVALTNDTPSISNVVTGAYTDLKLTRCGNLVTLRFYLYNNNSIAGGSDFFKATIEEKYRPVDHAMGVGYYGNHIFPMQITSGGVITVRHVGSAAVTTSSSSTVWVSATYIVK